VVTAQNPTARYAQAEINRVNSLPATGESQRQQQMVIWLAVMSVIILIGILALINHRRKASRV
jgi:hypothetical protein